MSRSKALKPEPDQESVWDYPRPPLLEPSSAHIQIRFGGRWIADSQRALRLLETSHPPTYYLPRRDIAMACLQPNRRRSLCEWKGQAHFFDLVAGGHRATAAAWTYPDPLEGYEGLEDHFAFYVFPMDECRVDGERATPQPGSFYGGWVTSRVVGPFKGEPGSWGW